MTRTIDPYRPAAFRQYATHPVIRQWNAACQAISAREKAMKRQAGIYRPGSRHYPMPEPGTQDMDRRITAYFTRARQNAYDRLIATLDPHTRATVYGI